MKISEIDELFEKCWKGYEKKGMKTMFGKRVPNCVKKESIELEESIVADLVAQTGQTPAEIYYQLTLLAAAVGGSLYVAGMLFAMHIEDIMRDHKKWKEHRSRYENNPELVKQDFAKAKKSPGIISKAKSLLSFFKKEKQSEGVELEEGSLTVSKSQLHDVVIDMIKDMDFNEIKKLAEIARLLGKEVFFTANGKVVVQSKDFDFNETELNEMISLESVLPALEDFLNEDLRAWFGKGKKGGAGGGGWDRYNTKGERVGKCGDSKPGEGKPKCLSKSRAASLRASGGKKAIANAVKRKKAKDPNQNRRGKAKNVNSHPKK